MTEPPTVLVPHTVSPEDASEFETAVGDRCEELVRTSSPSETREALPGAEVLVTFRPPAGVPGQAPELAWIQALSSGVNHYDHGALSEAGVALTNAAGVHAQPIAEQVLGSLLTFERGLDEAARNQRRGVWQRYEGGELGTRTVGILGLGAIGGRVAELLSAFGSTVLGTKRDLSSVPDGVEEVFGAEEYWPVLERADHVVIACPLTDETRGLVGSDELRLLPDDGVVVNVARGEVVDQDALVRTLQNGSIGGAALDVFEEEPLPPESPLWDLPNALVTPHVAGTTPEYVRRCAEIFADNYDRFLAGAELENRVTQR
jgi:phosphoglycerate dehydrogenase-like enzyme